MDIKKFVSGASTALNRAVQKTEETFLQIEKTEYDPYFTELAKKCDVTKLWTECIIKEVGAFLEPNPVFKFTNRMELLVNERLERKQTERMNSSEELGNSMMRAGGEIGIDSVYGKALINAGQSEIYIGRAQKSMSSKIMNGFIVSLKSFFTNELKNIQNERKTLENLRLDLDLSKNRMRKAKTEHSIQIAEADLRKAQGNFDDQLVITKLHMEGIKLIHSQHLEALKRMLVEQREYYAECHKVMQDLTSQLGQL